jgi:hypothetical protein
MPWLDNFLAVPTIGVRIKTKFKSVLLFRDSLVQLFDYLTDKYQEIQIKEVNIWGFSITPVNKSGFCYQVNQHNIAINYKYHISQKIVSGKFPTFEQPELKLYSELLSINFDEISRVLKFIETINDIKYDRIGIVADTNLPVDSLPPGIVYFIDHLGKPWNKELIKVDSTLLSKLNEGKSHIDQCHHAIKFNKSVTDGELIFKLDWQRLYSEPLLLDFNKIKEEISLCINQALNYFERFGEGDLNYE